MDADWANLRGPLSLILDKLVEPIDHVWFSAVCKNWYSIAMVNHQNYQLMSNRIVLPMLMIPTRMNIKKSSLYGILSNQVYNINLPMPYDKRCCGSSHGWLAMADRYGVITLFNPFKNVVSISLPPIKKRMLGNELTFCYVHKVFLSANPAIRPHDYVVAAIYSFGNINTLAFMKSGEGFWKYIDYNFHTFTDVIFYKGVVYAVGRWSNTIVSYDVSYSKNGANILSPNVVSYGGVNSESYADRAYLVKSLEGDLWLVRRFMYIGDDYIKCTRRFQVYKLVIDEQSGKLLQMWKLNNLGDNVLFVGNGDSISISASYFANFLKRDSVYYTDDRIYDGLISNFFSFDQGLISNFNGPFDSGIYNVKDGSFRKHYIYGPSFIDMPPPVWVEPQFYSG